MGQRIQKGLPNRCLGVRGGFLEEVIPKSPDWRNQWEWAFSWGRAGKVCKKVFSAQNCMSPIPGARASMVYSGTERRAGYCQCWRWGGERLAVWEGNWDQIMKDLEKFETKFRLCSKGQKKPLKAFKPGADWKWSTSLEARRPASGIDLFWFSELQFLIFEMRTITRMSGMARRFKWNIRENKRS